MRIFKKGNWENTKNVCPICKTQKEGEVTLLAISGTQEGHNVQAKQVHVDCLDLWYDHREGIDIIFQRIRK